uniref:Uncharacterized protein n=1 Tax=Callithrix jacchus TaxID=9483 RepID=A0A5F4WMH6_CALJA
MEKHFMFMVRKNQYHENGHTAQSNLQIQCYPHQDTNDCLAARSWCSCERPHLTAAFPARHGPGRRARLTCLREPRVKAAVMLTLASKLKRVDGLKGSRMAATASDSTRRVSVRDKLLVKEVAELEANLTYTCKVHFPDPNKLHCFQLTVTPASQSEMPDQDRAPQHHRDRGDMSEFTERTFYWRHWLGSHKNIKGCCLGIKLFVY